MTAKSTSRGHEIESTGKAWVYSDTKESAFDKRKCKHCGKEPVKFFLNCDGLWVPKNIDACIASIVESLQVGNTQMVSSCCGHKIRDGWIALADGRTLVIKKKD